MNKLILVDGYSFLFRAFYAIKNLNRSDGTPVGALYGFTRMLIKIITEIEYTHIAVVFDAGEKTFRNDMYSDYKANRPPCPDDLIPQFALVREIVNVLNIATLEKVGFEADDIIATYTHKAEKENFETIIVSSDKDLMQLITSNTKMFDGMKNEIVNEEKVKEKWGVYPNRLLDVLSLMGDTSDNVPGAPGIGPKTASDLINQYGSLDILLQNLNSIKQTKRRETLQNNIEQIHLSKRLITLDDNVSLKYSLEDLEFKQYDYKKLLNFLKQQEFYSMVKGLEKAFACSIPNNENSLSNNTFEKDKDNIVENNKIISSEATENNNFIEISNLKDLEMLIKDSIKNNTFYFNMFQYKNQVLSITFGIYIIKINYTNDLFNSNEYSLNNILKYFQKVLEDSSILKISYNIKKQLFILNFYNISINNFEDIEVIHYILYAGLHNSNLFSIISHIFPNSNETLLNILFKIEKENSISNLEENIYALSAFICNNIIQLHQILKSELNKDEKLSLVYESIEKHMTAILSSMETTGIKIDINKLKNLSLEFSTHIEELRKQIYEIAGQEFNISSPKQLAEILFTKLGYKSPTKKISTNVEVLEELSEQNCGICKKILMFRHYSKLKNTYTDILPTLIDKNERVHTTYSNTFVITGRLSSANPNLQNLPVKTESGSKIRSAFIAKNGCQLVSADYKQAELRVIANYQNVEKLKEDFLLNKDIHTATASKVFNIPEDKVSYEERNIAKAINFSIIYGTSAFGLAKRINKSNEEAKEYLNNYFKIYPEIQTYINFMKDFVRKNNCVHTMFGRKINIDIANARPMFRGGLERLAINAPIQGTASDIIKKAMIILQSKLKNYQSKMILQIHDELVLEVPNEELDEIVSLLKFTMENVVNWEIKMEVDVRIGINLEEM